MARGRLNWQLFSIALGMLLPLGQALGQAEAEPKPKPVLEEQLTESDDGRLLLEGKPYTGEVAKYYSNKKKAESYSLKKGKLHGPFITYREDGSPAFQVTFADGIEHGPFKTGSRMANFGWRKTTPPANSKASAKPIFQTANFRCSPFIGREKRKDWRLAGTRTASNAGR